MVDIGSIVSGVVRGAVSSINPYSESHKSAGTQGPMVATLLSSFIYLIVLYGGLFDNFSMFVAFGYIILSMVFFMVFIGRNHKIFIFVAMFQFIIIFTSGIYTQYSFLGALTTILDFIIIFPVWPVFGLIIFFGTVNQAYDSGIEVPTIAKILYVGIILILIGIFISYFVNNFYQAPAQARLVEAKQLALNVWTFVRDNTINAFNITRYTIGCLFKQIIGQMEEASVDECVQNLLHPPEEQKITGGVDETFNEVVSVELRDPPYSTTDFLSDENFEVGALLEVYNPKKESLEVTVECKIENSRKEVVPSKIIGTRGQEESNTYKFVDVKRLYSDLICYPTVSETSKVLPRGSYTVTFEATVKNIEASAKLVNLFMNEDSLKSLLSDYAKEKKITVTSRTESSVMKALFPDLIRTYYPNGLVESKAETSFLRPLIQTEDRPIIGFLPSTQSQAGSLRLKLGVQNVAKGDALSASMSFTLPEDMKVVEGFCQNFKQNSANPQMYDYNGNLPLDKLKVGSSSYALPSCNIDTRNLQVINPNVPEPRTFETKLKYNYKIKKITNVRVSGSVGNVLSSSGYSVDTSKCTIKQANKDSLRNIYKGKTYKKYIIDATFGKAYMSPELLAALIDQESGFTRTAVSTSGCAGLTQICYSDASGYSGIISQYGRSIDDVKDCCGGTGDCRPQLKIWDQSRGQWTFNCVKDGENMDPRFDPAIAITIGPLHYNNKRVALASQLSGLDSDTQEKVTLASYNGGQAVLRDAIAATGKTNPTWDEIKNQISVSILKKYSPYNSWDEARLLNKITEIVCYPYKVQGLKEIYKLEFN